MADPKEFDRFWRTMNMAIEQQCGLHMSMQDVKLLKEVLDSRRTELEELKFRIRNLNDWIDNLE